MKKNLTQKGISVIEVVVAIAVFSILVIASYNIFIGTNNLVKRLDSKSTAFALAEEGIEASRSIRDQDFALLTAGTKGLSLGTGSWQFSGTSDTTNGYQRRVVVTAVDADTYTIVSHVDWSERGATSTVSLSTRLTNWKKSVGMSNGTTFNTAGVNLSAADSARLLDDMTMTTDGSFGTTTITRIQLTWTGVPTTRRLQTIRSPDGTTVWSGTVASGVNNTLTTQINMLNVATRDIDFRFNAAMTGASFTIVYTFSDLTTKTVTVNSPPAGP